MHLENREIDPLHHDAEQVAAEAQRQSQQLLKVLDTIGDRVFLKDTQGRVTYVNQAFLKAFGLSSADVIGKQHAQFLPPEMVEPCQAADNKVLELGEAICLETNWRDRAGNRRWSETLKSPLCDSQGNFTGIVGISRDVTDRRATEEELKRQKTLLELIVETVPDWIFVKDRDRRILLANRAFYTQQRLSPEDVLGHEVTENLPDAIREISYQSDTSILAGGAPQVGEVAVPDADGNERHIEFRKLPLVEDGQITGIVAVCRDLTERKEAEEQSKRNEAFLLHASRLSSMGELVAGIAHEVNQPLFSILNYAKAVENMLQSEGDLDLVAIRKWVQQIHKEAARGGKITQRLKSFVRRSESQQQLSDLNQVVNESLEILRIEARDAGLTIETELAENLPAIMLDRIQIQQVLINLLKNAIEALREEAVESPKVLVTTRHLAAGVEVSVADNGPGVTASADANILDPFQTTKHEGIGLGLAISNTIIEAHQGELVYHSNDWGGVTFSFTLQSEK